MGILAWFAVSLLLVGDVTGGAAHIGAGGLQIRLPRPACSRSQGAGGPAPGLLRLRGGAFWFSATAGEEEIVSVPPLPSLQPASTPSGLPTRR